MTRKLGPCTILIIMACTLFSAKAFADEVEVKATQVANQVFMITGKGGNIGLFIGADGTFLIDDQFAPLTDEILEAAKSVGGKHPDFLINTHYHGDHTGGNEKLGAEGTLIFSHHNVRERLSKGSFIKAFNNRREAVARVGLPVVTFSEDIVFHLNGDTVRVLHLPHAHTDGDSLIFFEKANVIHAGDILFNGYYPFIDVQHGGSLRGMIAATDQILAMADDATRIIAGHGPVATKKDVTDYRQMLATAYDRLRELKESGKDVAEAVAANPLADLEDKWGDGLFSGERWIEIIYPGIY